ncbi:hypothetical protein KQX54_007575 [Cotesia glomerata]|uniref:Uncharacterized protein n=1 Tax=Cotesia glomerata TaxID=32391 RepID=A0AAV7ITV5_COTGL|nr:hypothetical protein KQX54_007575 [Cotesia glomerata]
MGAIPHQRIREARTSDTTDALQQEAQAIASLQPSRASCPRKRRRNAGPVISQERWYSDKIREGPQHPPVDESSSAQRAIINARLDSVGMINEMSEKFEKIDANKINEISKKLGKIDANKINEISSKLEGR